MANKTEGNAIKKRKQRLVKHKRKNWKKTDLAEIEKNIEDLKHEERTGGIRSEKANEELFFIDKTKGSIDVNKDDEEKDSFKNDLKKSKKLELELNNLKCYRNLLPDPFGAPKHFTYSFKPKNPNSNRSNRYIEREAKKLEAEIEKKKKKPVNINEKDVKAYKFDTDLWGNENKQVITETNEYHLRSTNKIMPKKPKNFDAKTSLLPAIELPHPGTSYNPTYEDHQELLLKAHMVELEKLKKEEKIIRNLDAKIPKMTHDQIEKMWLSEMSSGLNFEKNEDKDEDAEPEINEQLETVTKPIPEKIPNKRKRKELEEKLKKKQKELEKQRRIQENEIYRLKSIKKEVLKKEEEQKTLKEKRDKLKEEKKNYKAHNLGHVKFEEPEIDLILSEELSGNLRNLKVQGDILLDRYKSFQKRNILEPRKRAKRFKKFWKKSFEKTTVKEVTV